MARALAVVIACSGCDGVFGLTPVAEPAMVQGTHTLRWTQNDVNGEPMTLEAPLPTVQLALRNVSSESPIEVAADGSFSFVTSGETYALVTRSPYVTVEYQLAAPTLHLVERLAGRPDRVPPPPNTHLLLSLTNRPAAATAPYQYLETTGIWMGMGLTETTVDIDWSKMNAPGGVGLLEADKHDTVMFSALSTVNPSGTFSYAALTHAVIVPDFTLPGGQATTLSAMVKQLAANVCIVVDAERKRELDRVVALTPGATSDTSLVVFATAGREFLGIAGEPLVLAIDAAPAGDDVGRQLEFAKPIAGTTPFLQMSIARYHSFGSVIFTTGTSVTVPIDAGSCPRVAVKSSTVAIPTGIGFDGRTITSDGPINLAQDRDLDLSWQLTADGDADYFVISIFEITATGLQYLHTIVTAERSAKLDPAWFQPQHQYVVSVEADIGAPNLASGDARELRPMFARGIAHTPMFTPQ